MLWQVGGRTAYAYTGGRPFDPSRPVIVFVHGAQHDHSVWILQSRYLAHHGFSVLAVDLPGHGRSTGPAPDSVPAAAQWLLDAVHAAGVERPILAGHSMGSLIALDAAGRSPSSVAGLVLLGAAFPMKVSPALLEAARDDEPKAFAMINAWSHSRLVHRPGCPGPGFSVINQNLALMGRQARGVLLNDFTACNAYADGLARAAQVTCPTLFVLGRRDAMTPPKAARDLVGRIAGSRVVEIDDCGHAMMAERPDKVLAAIRDFVAGLPAATTGAPA